MLEDISTTVAKLRNKPATALVCNVNILCMVYVHTGLYVHLYITKPKHPRCKKEWPSTKRALLKKMYNQIGDRDLLSACRFKSFGCNDLTIKHCYSGCSRPPDVDRITI